jgi:DNA-binding response OmpR family regulator
MNKTTNRILIIEDEKPMAKALALKFEHDGFFVTNAHNGKEALAILKKETFDVILLDLIMPEMDGFKVMEALEEEKCITPVFILTNLSQDEEKKRLAKLGAQDFFIKSDTPIANIVLHITKFLN